jgi:hypothetical protein
MKESYIKAKNLQGNKKIIESKKLSLYANNLYDIFIYLFMPGFSKKKYAVSIQTCRTKFENNVFLIKKLILIGCLKI